MQRQTRILIICYVVFVILPLLGLLAVGVLLWRVPIADAAIMAAGLITLLSIGVMAQIKYGNNPSSPTSHQIRNRYIWGPLLAATLSTLSLVLKMPTIVTACAFFGVLVAVRVHYYFGK
jgi:arginine exporter protein ArgO